MKKITLSLMFFTCIATALNAQDTTRTILKFSPFYLGDFTLRMGVEFLNKDLSRSHNIFPDVTYQVNGDYEEWGATVEYQYRIYTPSFTQRPVAYLKNNNYLGIYMGPSLRVGYYETKDITRSSTNTKKISVVVPGMLLGIQRTFGVLYLDVYLGGALRIAGVQSELTVYGTPPSYYEYNYTDVFSRDYKGVIPKVGANIGIGF